MCCTRIFWYLQKFTWPEVSTYAYFWKDFQNNLIQKHVSYQVVVYSGVACS